MKIKELVSSKNCGGLKPCCVLFSISARPHKADHTCISVSKFVCAYNYTPVGVLTRQKGLLHYVMHCTHTNSLLAVCLH